MRRRYPNQRRRRCRRSDDAVGCLVRTRILRLLICCCENTHKRHLWQRLSNSSKRRPSARVLDHASEPQIKSETIRARCMLILVLMLMRCLRNSLTDHA